MNFCNNKNCVGYIVYSCLICYIGYIVSALFTQKTSTLLIPCIFLNLFLIRIQGFPGGEKLRKCNEIFTKIVMGSLGMPGLFFSKVLSTLMAALECQILFSFSLEFMFLFIYFFVWLYILLIILVFFYQKNQVKIKHSLLKKT